MLLTNNFLCVVTFAAGIIISSSSFSPPIVIPTILHHGGPKKKRTSSAVVTVNSIHGNTISGKKKCSINISRSSSYLFAESEKDEYGENGENIIGSLPSPPAPAPAPAPPAANSEDAMMKRLENESKYPLKFPLLGISLVLFGKGLSDALITIIKVSIDFPGASLTEQFVGTGVPVLAIDAVCVVVGVALASWTWKTMKNN